MYPIRIGMNVAIFASAFHPSLGGVEEVVRQVAHEYKRQGISTIVLTNRWPRSQPRHEIYEGIPVYRLAMRLPEYTLKVRLNYWLTLAGSRAEMLRILRHHHCDIIHVHCVSSNGHYALMAREALGLPLVVTAHGERTIDAGHVYEGSIFINRLLRKLLADADYVTACSKDTLADLESYCGRPFGNRASVVYSGIRLDEFDGASPYQHPRDYILAIGRMVPQKGFDLLIEAFAKANLHSHDLLIAGDGPERDSLEHLSRKYELGDRVRFIGRADRKTTAALFKGCSFFVLPSRQEPMGIVNLEAMAVGRAVIASKVGGVPEIVVDGETGLLVPPESTDALASAMTHLANDENLRIRLGRSGMARAQGFGWGPIAKRYVEIYEGALACNKRLKQCA